MIISASRRTDIPAFYTDWFLNRIREGYVCVRNPFSYHQVSKITLNPDLVDTLVFWTKNPVPLMKHLSDLNEYMYYFQFTLNTYGREVERNLPSLENRIETFRELASCLGKERIIWRYDPIGISPAYTVDWHLKQFERLANALAGSTETCVISFLDLYPSVLSNLQQSSMTPPDNNEIAQLAQGIASITAAHGIRPTACCEATSLSAYGIEPAHCIDGELLARLLGCKLNCGRDGNQRKNCGCVESIDIGAYGTCRHGCAYCYAGGQNGGKKFGWESNSPLLGSKLTTADKIKERAVQSFKDLQLSLF